MALKPCDFDCMVLIRVVYKSVEHVLDSSTSGTLCCDADIIISSMGCGLLLWQGVVEIPVVTFVFRYAQGTASFASMWLRLARRTGKLPYLGGC